MLLKTCYDFSSSSALVSFKFKMHEAMFYAFHVHLLLQIVTYCIGTMIPQVGSSVKMDLKFKMKVLRIHLVLNGKFIISCFENSNNGFEIEK